MRKWYAAAAYSALAVAFVVGLLFITKPSRETSLILTSVHVFLNDVKSMIIGVPKEIKDYVKGLYGKPPAPIDPKT
jgi:NADH:ubiquinone oxidoreductase subunit K